MGRASFGSWVAQSADGEVVSTFRGILAALEGIPDLHMKIQSGWDARARRPLDKWDLVSHAVVVRLGCVTRANVAASAVGSMRSVWVCCLCVGAGLAVMCMLACTHLHIMFTPHGCAPTHVELFTALDRHRSEPDQANCMHRSVMPDVRFA